MADTQKTEVENTYYTYTTVTLDNGSVFQIYSGTPVVQSADLPAPENSVKWKPNPAPAGYASYFDGVGWVIGRDVRTLTLEQLKAVCHVCSDRAFQGSVDSLQDVYTAAERSSWSQQLADAQTMLSGAAASTLITSLAAARGVDAKTLAQKVVEKNGAYQDTYVQALANYQKQRDAIQGATAIKDLPPISLQDVEMAIGGISL